VTALSEARRLGATAAFLRPAEAWPPALAQITTDVPRRFLTGPAGAWYHARWLWAGTRLRLSACWRARVTSVRRELARELRKHAGDERIPAGVRTRLKTTARAVGHPAPKAAAARFPRRLLRERVQVSLEREARARAAHEAIGAGIPLARPLVAFELPHHVATALPAVSFLVEQGYGVVRIGDPCGGAVDMPGVVDLASAPRPNPQLEFHVLQSARFIVCQSLDLQYAAYLTGTPSLILNARDPISRYPIRPDGVFTLTRAVDLDSGRLIPLRERLGAAVFHNERNIGHAPSGPATILEAVREMHEGTSGTWHETSEQAAFRAAAAEAAEALAHDIPLIAAWGADDGFIGEGRLARVQAAVLSGACKLTPGAST
jgi:putative glycosyltransferase (TIGR04372 family)